jgi:hypothetical protein
MYNLPKIITTILASSLMLSSPVNAGGNNFLKGIVVGAGAVIIGKRVIDNNKKKNNSQQKVTTSSKATREQLTKDQTALAELGYYTLKIDGRGGPGTRRAINGFQNDNGYSPTGRLTSDQRQELFQLANVGGFGGGLSDDDSLFASTDPQDDTEVDIFGNSTEDDSDLLKASVDEEDIFGNDTSDDSTDLFDSSDDELFSKDALSTEEPDLSTEGTSPETQDSTLFDETEVQEAKSTVTSSEKDSFLAIFESAEPTENASTSTVTE